MNDLIDILKYERDSLAVARGSDYSGVIAIEEAIQILSAQLEPHEDDPRADVYYLAEKIGIHQLYALVVELRGEPEPCVDAVNRELAMGLLYDVLDRIDQITPVDIGIYQIAKRDMEDLPPATPKCKTGKWMPMHGGKFTGGAYWFRCEKCDHIVPGGLQSGKFFCENCGTDMREEDD